MEKFESKVIEAENLKRDLEKKHDTIQTQEEVIKDLQKQNERLKEMLNSRNFIDGRRFSVNQDQNFTG